MPISCINVRGDHEWCCTKVHNQTRMTIHQLNSNVVVRWNSSCTSYTLFIAEEQKQPIT
uniref:Uncharacterized protein n=1 Tax=Parascaris equorum TaxID=6256 RepID=A0A914R6L1_PAREQ